MDEFLAKRFAEIGAKLIEKGYMLYPITKQDNIFGVEWGCFIRAIHRSDKQEEQCLLYVPDRIFGFPEIIKLRTSEALKKYPIYAIEQTYLAFFHHIQYSYQECEELAKNIQQTLEKPTNLWLQPRMNPQKRIAWLTDVHFNFLSDEQFANFSHALARQGYHGYILTGDLAEAHDVERFMQEFAQIVRVPVYFILGNHDYYGSSFAKVNANIHSLCQNHTNLFWLSERAPISLIQDVAIIGHEGCADGRYGDFLSSTIVMNDYFCIEEIASHHSKINRKELLLKLQKRAEEATQVIEQNLIRALSQYPNVVFATHYPPFELSATYLGKVSELEWLPHFSSKIMGDMLIRVMSAYPNQKLLVLCGHTHGVGATEVLPNILVLTGEAEYGHPTVQHVLEL